MDKIEATSRRDENWKIDQNMKTLPFQVVVANFFDIFFILDSISFLAFLFEVWMQIIFLKTIFVPFVHTLNSVQHGYQMSCGVNRSSLLKWLLLQNCLKINKTPYFSLKLFPVISAGPHKYKYKISQNFSYLIFEAVNF